ncbi:hypothetical protein RJT34_04184 [Clitoria ternatea]|uniref:Transmembrane protein n=1 Tax=Clitoria ternatea TaxID=43366 RepID=A0AAN9KNJ6_CLITE
MVVYIAVASTISSTSLDIFFYRMVLSSLYHLFSSLLCIIQHTTSFPSNPSLIVSISNTYSNFFFASFLGLLYSLLSLLGNRSVKVKALVELGLGSPWLFLVLDFNLVRGHWFF